MDNSGNFTYLNIDDILPNRFQPRIHFDDQKLNELAESIRKYGVIEPIVVRQIGSKYEIIAGERRYKASKLANKSTIPTIVTDLSDKESEEIALLENVQRQNLTPIEEAVSYKRILDMGYITQEDLARKLGKSQSTIANKIRLLNLDDNVQYALLNGKISERHARSLLRLHDSEDQVKMLNKIIDERLTVKKTDDAINEFLGDQKTEITEPPKKEIKEETIYKETPENKLEETIIKELPKEEIKPFKINGPIENLFVEPIKKPKRRAVAVASHEIIRLNPPKEVEELLKRKEESAMDIDKIMQEAQDINVDTPAKDISGLMSQDGISTPIMPVQPAAPEPASEEAPLVQEQNKFVNLAPEPAKDIENSPLLTPQTNGVTFDSIFNQTPADLQSTKPLEQTKPVENNQPMMTDPNLIIPNVQEPVSQPAPVQPTIPEITPTEPVIPEINPSVPEPQPVVPEMSQDVPEVAPTAPVQPTMNNQAFEAPTFNEAPQFNAPEQNVQPAPEPVMTAPEPIIPQNTEPTTIAEAVQNAINSEAPAEPQMEQPTQALYNELVSPNFGPQEQNVPGVNMMENNANMPQKNFNEVLNLIRNCANEIEKLGYYIDVTESDLGPSYQATFRINKQ